MNSNETVNGTGRRSVSEAGCFVVDPSAIKGLRIFAYCIIIIVSLLGNAMVVAVIFRNKSMWKTVNFFIVNLSLADLLVTITYMPRIISLAYAGYAWQILGGIGLVFCKIACFNEVAIFVAIFTIVAISFDRFFAVVFPLRRFMSVPICQGLIFCIWMAALAAGFPEFYAIELRLYQSSVFCYLDLDFAFGPGSSKAYYKFIIIGAFAVPLAIITVLYSAIILTLIKNRNIPGQSSSVNDAQARIREESKRKVLKMVSIVVGTFILCWLLYFIHFIVYSYGITLPCELMFLRLFLAHFHCAFSPFIYGFYNAKFRDGMKSIITGNTTRSTRNEPRGNQVAPANTTQNNSGQNTAFTNNGFETT
ncbi:substance-P receptor-like [Actinia tenebrosa]|uniref:Substance-P receptor-like n=1 Tax=Actinia tenebrosa TaxID=6105 RepID=A0A6P8HVK1_ACTTE|nr:substance-P receptor-like [Actinia tenebrosa]